LALLIGNLWTLLILHSFATSSNPAALLCFGQQDASVGVPGLRGLASSYECWYPSRACKQCFRKLRDQRDRAFALGFVRCEKFSGDFRFVDFSLDERLPRPLHNRDQARNKIRRRQGTGT
jgi:hypothetical protein